MEEEKFEALSDADMAEIKGGGWVLVDGELVWVDDSR
jgi:hypothetical protein